MSLSYFWTGRVHSAWPRTGCCAALSPAEASEDQEACPELCAVCVERVMQAPNRMRASSRVRKQHVEAATALLSMKGLVGETLLQDSAT